MRSATLAACCILISLAGPAGAFEFEEVFIPQGRVALAASGPVTAVAVGGESIFAAELDGNRVCEYTLAGNPRRCLDALPTHRGPMEVSDLAYLPPTPENRGGVLYVSAPAHERIYKVDLHTGRVDPDDAWIRAGNVVATDYGVLVGRPVKPGHPPGVRAFHRYTHDLHPAWSFEKVRDPWVAESPWAPLAVGPTGDVYGAVAGRYEIVRYDPQGRRITSFGHPLPIHEDVVPSRDLPRSEWLELWSPIVRMDRIGDWLLVTSHVRRSGRIFALLDIYSLDGSPAVRGISLDTETPVATSGGTFWTLRRDEPGVVLYRWDLDVPAGIPEGGVVAALPPALTPVRAASGMVGDLDWPELRPYLESVYGVVHVRSSRPDVKFTPDRMAELVPGYIEGVGDSVAAAVGQLIHEDVGKRLRRGFRSATWHGAGAETATEAAWDAVMENPKHRTVLRGELCLELRQRGYPCP